MKKRWLTLCSLFVATAVFAASAPFQMTVPFRVDDFEEAASDLVEGVSVSTNLLDIATVVSIDDHIRKLVLLSKPDVYGQVDVVVNTKDRGYVASRTPLLSITPDITTSTNADSTNVYSFHLTGNDGSVDLWWWNGYSNQFGYKINRFSTSNMTDKSYTIGTTTGNTFTDTNVVNGVTYWYNVSWIPVGIGPVATNELSSEVVFDVRVREPVLVRPHVFGGMYFIARSNAIYQVFYRTNVSQPKWTLWAEMDLPKDRVVILNDESDFFTDNLIHVREKE